MAALLTAIPGDGFRLFGLDPATGLINRLLAASDDDAWARLEWLRDVYFACAPLTYIEHQELMRLRLSAVAVHPRQDECWGYPPEVLDQLSPRDHYRLFNELRSPSGGTLLAHFATNRRWIATLQLYRRDVGARFSRDEVTFVRGIGSRIGEALAASLSRERASQCLDAQPHDAGVLVISPERRLTLCTRAGEEWLAYLHDADRSGHAPLPTAIWSAIAGARAGSAKVGVPTTRGPLIIEASVAGPDGSVAIVLNPERAPPPSAPDEWGLTEREREIVGFLIRGLRNREIGERLFISENTVEWHLRQAYEKLDVRSRGQLLARLFRDVYWPSLNEECADRNHDDFRR